MAPAGGGARQGMRRRWRRPHSCGRGPELGRRRPHSGWAAPPRALGSAMAWMGGVWGGQGGGRRNAPVPAGEEGAGGGGRRHRPKPSPCWRLFVIKYLR